MTLLAVYDLHTAPLEQLGDSARYQHHPVVADLKSRLERDWLGELEVAWCDAGALADATDPRSRRLTPCAPSRPRTGCRRPTAGWPRRRRTTSSSPSSPLEGGPDGGFDDLVAACQIGLSGSAKLELGKNYWDEMGQGDPDGVHTVLHQRMAAALGLPHVPRAEQPLTALERAALGGLLATNRWLQPELIGALGLLELQAGPRCRLVLQAFDRLGAPAAAYPFYVEHAEVDPVHGKDWLDKAVLPLVDAHPQWGPRIIKGAWWRSMLNLRLFAALHDELAREPAAA